MSIENIKKNGIANFFKSDYSDIVQYFSEKDLLIVLSQQEISRYNEMKIYLSNMKQKTKNQHYVPQFYLNLFTNDHGRLETFDIKTGQVIKSQSPKKVCSKDFFYGVSEGSDDFTAQLIEDYLGGFEDDFSSIYEALLKKISLSQSIEEYKYDLCVFVTISLFRGKYFRDRLKEAEQRIYKKMTELNVPELLEVEDNNIDHIKRIVDEKNIKGYANLFFNKKIRIYISNGERNFVTSDNCVLDVAPETKGPFGSGFFDRYQYFVLSPHILIEFSNPSLPGKKIKRQTIGKKDIIFFNNLRCSFSKYLYSKDKNDFLIDDYTESRINDIDKYYKLFPTKFEDDKKSLEKLKIIAKKNNIRYKDNLDLIEKAKPYYNS